MCKGSSFVGEPGPSSGSQVGLRVSEQRANQRNRKPHRSVVVIARFDTPVIRFVERIHVADFRCVQETDGSGGIGSA